MYASKFAQGPDLLFKEAFAFEAFNF